MLNDGNDKSTKRQRHGVAPSMRDRLVCVSDRGDAILLVHPGPGPGQDMVTPSSETVCERIIRLKRQRAFDERNGLAACFLWHRRVRVRQRPQIEVVGVEIVGPLAPTRSISAWRRLGSIDADHARGDLVLQIEDVVERAVETCRPTDARRSRRR